MVSPARSPYEVALGDAAFGEGGLHPRLGSRFLPVPRRLAPRIALSERFSDVEDAQAVRVTLTLPLLGTFYEYEGLFTYELKEGTP